jgi:hypothetical protein
MFKSTKTVASITAGLGNMVTSLETLQADRTKAAEMALSEAAKLTAEADAHTAEAARAAVVAGRIRDLVA